MESSKIICPLYKNQVSGAALAGRSPSDLRVVKLKWWLSAKVFL